MSTRLHIVVSDDLLARIDHARGADQPEPVPRSVFVRRAVEQALSEAKEPSKREQADPGSVSSSEGVRSAAPAEQSLKKPGVWDGLATDRKGPFFVRSSVEARPFRPVPKGKA